MAIGKLIQWLRGTKEIRPLPDKLWQETIAALPFLDRLTREEKSRLRSLAEAFLAEKEFTAAGGLEITDPICVSIAVQGCLPILNLGLESYRNWVGVIVYPDEFIIPRSVEDEYGVVHDYNDVASGEAWDGGPVIVSWHDAQMAGSGYNVVIHEFAHKLDMLGGDANGLPPLPDGLSRRQWEETLLAAYDDFCAKVAEAETAGAADDEEDGQDQDDGGRCAHLAFDPYGAENPGEFFAVMSEAFFETPDVLREDYPALYAQFSRFYRQDPAAR